MLKLLVFDVDGTLYDLKNHEIPSSCQKAIAQAKQNGLIFVIATGRTHYGFERLESGLHFGGERRCGRRWPGTSFGSS